MIIRSKAPLRLGFAGGGTDVSPYSDEYGGAILNATISMYAYATLEPRDDNKIVLQTLDRGELLEYDSVKELPINGDLDLLKGVYNRICKDYDLEPMSFTLSTYVDAPAGSGLGTSSTLVVAIIGAFVEWHKLPLGEYDIAQLAYDIERIDLKMAGGKQDQYCATFGGVNFMEFYEGNRVVVNPLRVKQRYLNELEYNTLLYYTGTSRLSAKIIEDQTRNISGVGKKEKSLEGMHRLKDQAFRMKEAILKGELNLFGDILNYGWESKKQLASSISNSVIDEIYEKAIANGAQGGKISGAGGGGFMILYCPGNARFKVMDALKDYGGEFKKYIFEQNGLTTWKIS